MHNKNNMKDGIISRINRLFVDREFFMYSSGRVRFLRISAKLQRFAAAIATLSLVIWLVATGAMLTSQYGVTRDRLVLNKEHAKLSSSAGQIAAYRTSVGDMAEDLSARQDTLDRLVGQYFVAQQVDGRTSSMPKPLGDPAENKGASQTGVDQDKAIEKIATAVPEVTKFKQLERRQLGFIDRLTRTAQRRIQRAETAIRKFGLNPEKLTAKKQGGAGGPFIPFLTKDRLPSGAKQGLHPSLRHLNNILSRMDVLERSLIAIPSSMPANSAMMSSGYGYRRDPFTRAGAMHSGIDFKGPWGTPIMAATTGTVTFAGWKSGYGKAVEITHGSGLMTRYAHLSRISTRAGQKINRGLLLGRMGSTGRSTGSHLHFEVRLNGRAINPRPFLEANSDVLEIQTVAQQRTQPRQTRTR